MKRVKLNNRTSTKPTFNYRSLVAGLFIAGGVFQLVTPVLAAPAANTVISNTATASYTDPSTNTTLNATSNTVTITIAEVAGITVIANNTPTNLQPGSTVPYEFAITNTGNDPTRLVIPNKVTVTGTGNGTQQGNLFVSYDNGATYTDIATLPGYNATTKELTTDGVVASNGSPGVGTVLVRAQILVPTTAAGGSTIVVRLGDTGATDLQNQLFAASGTNTDVYTKDDNTLTTPAGEANTTSPLGGEKEASATLSGTVGNIASVLNGTESNPAITGSGPAAIGADGTNNTDFTNKALAPTNTTPNTTLNDPNAVSFTNTLLNTGNATATFLIQPNTLLTNTLPTTGITKITITPTGGTAGTFEWNGTAWSTITPASVSVPAGTEVSYTVAVDLPLGTKLSTDLTAPGDLTGATATVQGGYAVPIVAFIDQGTTGLDADDPRNTTIDRIYLGYVAMYKEAQILEANGQVVQIFTTDAVALTGKLTPGRIVEYRISYKNISEATATATGSVGLTAANFTITEDGTAAPNNWGTTTTHKAASDSRNPAANVVTSPTVYTDAVGALNPGESGALNIQRTLNP